MRQCSREHPRATGSVHAHRREGQGINDVLCFAIPGIGNLPVTAAIKKIDALPIRNSRLISERSAFPGSPGVNFHFPSASTWCERACSPTSEGHVRGSQAAAPESQQPVSGSHGPSRQIHRRRRHTTKLMVIRVVFTLVSSLV